MSATDPAPTLQPISPNHVIRPTTTTLVTTRSIIFSSSLYNSNATLSDDLTQPPTARPVLTPPLTPLAWTALRGPPQPAEMTLAGGGPGGGGEEKQDGRVVEQDGQEGEDGIGAEQATMRNRRLTRSQSRKHTAEPRQQSTQRTEEKEQTTTAATQSTSSSAATSSTNLSSSLPTTQPPNQAETAQQPTSPSHSQQQPQALAQRIHPSQLVPSYPFHRKSQPSALSTEAPPVSLRGLYNLAGITLFTLTARLVLENVLKYGWLMRMNMVYALSEDWERTWPCLAIAFFVCCVSPVVSWAVERWGGEGEAWERWMGWVHALHIVGVFVVPQVIITVTNASIISGLVLAMVVMVMTMKLVSFAHVCHDIRHRIRMRREGKSIPSTATTPPSQTTHAPASTLQDVSALHPVLPEHYSVDLSHVLYFMLAPTLIYQLSYPKSSPTGHIRVVFLLRRVVELVFCCILQLLIIEQYLYPTVRNAMQSISGLHYLAILERILKIALPNGVVWLLMFYALFHSWLNILAELMNFGDRLFYKEWWNCANHSSTKQHWAKPCGTLSLTSLPIPLPLSSALRSGRSLDQYWNSWNLPVHNFVMRHLYAPLLRSGMSVWLAQLISFLASAIAHELLVAIPLHTLKLYAFFGMLAQVPLIYFTRWIVRRFQQPVWSNCVFWLTFLVFGQPLLILLYAHAVLSRTAQMVEPNVVIVPPLPADFTAR